VVSAVLLFVIRGAMAGMAHKRYSIAMRQVDQDLFDACEDGDLEKAKRLIEKGADINAKDNDGWTPLHYACGHNGNKAITSLLLENGANVDVKDYFNGWTPLHYARNEAIASLLLEKGANINAKSHDGLTPLQLASTKGHEAIALLFLEKGADVNSQDNNGETPLHNASANGHEAIVSLLLEKGANIEAKDEDGDTSLHDASSNGHKAIVSLLLENGADLTITNNNGKTPWQIAQSWNKQDCVAAIEKFLQQKEYSEKFETRAALDQELQQLQHVMDAARDSLDPNVFLAAASAKAEYEIIIPLRKWPQYMSVSELELEIARLEDKARGLKSGKERIKVFRKIVQLRKTLEPFVHDGMKTTLQLAQEQLFDEIRRTLTSNFIRDIVVTSCPTYNTISKLTKKIARLEEMVQGMDIGKERMDVFLECNKLKQRLQGEIQQETKTPLQLAKEKLPDDIQRIFICPISGDFMKDPVTLYPSGKTFDRESICTWLLRGTIPPRCPWTNKEVDRQIPYMENLDTRNFLIHYLGKEAYD
jgi:ankyrin repeat protein